jgi:thymidylate kinase
MQEERPIYIILEGPDRCGKDTQQELVIKNMPDHVFHKMHYSALPFKDPEKHITHSSQLYDQLLRSILAFSQQEISVIFNRSYLSESVYAPLYRGYSGDYVFDIEKRYTTQLTDQLYLVTMVNDPNILMSRDDGKSQHGSLEDIQAEIDGFVRAHHKSSIKNKLLINVKDMSPNEVSTMIVQFLHERRPEYSKQQYAIDFETDK